MCINCTDDSSTVVGAPPKFLCSAACPLAGANLSALREGCVAYSSLCTALHRHSGFSSFKAGQLEALLSALLSALYGKDTYIRMATGGGKSLCMYLAPLASSTSAVGVVISPLVGLMDEQVTSKFSI